MHALGKLTTYLPAQSYYAAKKQQTAAANAVYRGRGLFRRNRPWYRLYP